MKTIVREVNILEMKENYDMESLDCKRSWEVGNMDMYVIAWMIDFNIARYTETWNLIYIIKKNP